MITRFYVDNYKCLQNFEYKPKPMELIIGANGSGKTTVFEALDKTRRFLVEQANAKELFPVESQTRWSNKSTQIFEIDFEVDGMSYQYRLEIDLGSILFRVEKEVVKRQDAIVMESIWKEVKGRDYAREDSDPFDLDDETHSNETRFFVWAEEGLEIPLSDPNTTMMNRYSWIPYGRELGRMSFFKLNPPLIGPHIGKVTPKLNVAGIDFGSYYLYTLQQRQSRMFDVVARLREVLLGFDSFSVSEDFENGKRDLIVNFRQSQGSKSKKNSTIGFTFAELSDGQRALIVLYTLVYCALDADTTLVIDEPENYIALRELQPLITAMEEQVAETGGQILLISHHPEIINLLTDRGKCVRLYRENNSHARIADFNPESELTPAEIVARGWEDDE